MVALTYYAHREKLNDVGRDGDLEEMNRQAVRIANEIAAEGGALVAGNICNTWSYDPADPRRSGAVVRAQYEEQLGWAVEEGIDFVIAETNDFVGEALIGLEVCQELGLPAMVTFASVQPETTYDGYDYVDACRVLADAGAAVVGLNCSRGPATMLPLLERIRAAVDIPIAALARALPDVGGHAGLRVARRRDGRRPFPIQLEPFQRTRFEMADFARRAADLGVGYIGICCGGAPHYVRAMAEALGRGHARQPLLAGARAASRARHPAGTSSMGGWTAGEHAAADPTRGAPRGAPGAGRRRCRRRRSRPRRSRRTGGRARGRGPWQPLGQEAGSPRAGRRVPGPRRGRDRRRRRRRSRPRRGAAPRRARARWRRSRDREREVLGRPGREGAALGLPAHERADAGDVLRLLEGVRLRLGGGGRRSTRSRMNARGSVNSGFGRSRRPRPRWDGAPGRP